MHILAAAEGLPVVPLIALLIWLTSSGPIYFVQDRAELVTFARDFARAVYAAETTAA